MIAKKFIAVLIRHSQVMVETLGRMCRVPFPTVLTTAVIAVSLAIPGVLYLAQKNLAGVVDQWRGTAQITIYLKPGVDSIKAQSLSTQVEARDEVSKVRYISPADALVEFRRLSGFGDVIDLLDDNPLPGTIVADLGVDRSTTAAAVALGDTLSGLDEVESVQLDSAWLQRLSIIVSLVRRGIILLAVFLSIAVILIVSNSVRLTGRTHSLQKTGLLK